MNVTMLLADSAQVADGKLYILGGGWSVTGPEPVPSAVAIKVAVDWHEFNSQHHWELILEDADGKLVQFETPEGTQTIEVRGDFSTSTPDDVPQGTPVDVPIAVNFGPIPLAPASRFTWRLVIDGESLPGASVSFTTRPRVEAAAPDED
ncbi:MAG: hypothetical protein ABR963_01480 [Acidimicrobiales bacterium]|jgi:hypothetical protein